MWLNACESKVSWTPMESHRSSICPAEGQRASGTIFIKSLYNISSPHHLGVDAFVLYRKIRLNHIWVQLFSGLRWGPTYTRPVPLCGSDLEDRLMRSAGRCSPLVTFTISPTATYMSQFKRIKMGEKKKKKQITEKIKTKQMDKRDRRFEIITVEDSC